MTERSNPRIRKARSLLLIFFLLVLLLAAAYYYFFRELRITGEKISTLSNETESLISEENNLSSLKAVFSDTTNERKKVQSYFVQSDGAIDFITTLENLASFANLSHQTQSVETRDESPVSKINEELHLAFRTSGSWQNTYYFISMLESLPYHLSIDQIDLHSTSGAATGATSTKGSIWDASYDISITKLK